MSEKEIREINGTDDILLGTREVTRELRQGNLEKVFLASNTPDNIKKDLKRYSNMSGTELEELDSTNRQVGVLCKKPFSIAVVGKKK